MAGTMKVNRAFTTLRGEIPYWEFGDGGYGERYMDEGSEIVNVLGCRWKDRTKFILAMLGFPYIRSGKLRRHQPEPHPDWKGLSVEDGLATPYAIDAEFLDGLGWAGRSSTTSALAYHDSPPAFDGSGVLSRESNDEGIARYRVTFRPRIYPLKSDDDADKDTLLEQSRWTSTTVEPGGENMPLPGNLLFFAPGEPVGDALAPVLFPISTYNYTWHELPADALPQKTTFGYWNGTTYVNGMVGSVNKNTFLGKEPESLLALAPTIRKYQSRTTDVLEDYTFHLAYRPQGWNRFLRNSGAWAKLYRSTDGGTTIDSTKSVLLTFPFEDVFDVSKP